MTTPSNSITIIGAGIAGAACAAVLRDAGIPFRVVDRGRAVGGRMASPTLSGRRVDIGAGYFTVRDPEFETLVRSWETAGLARPWTDTFGVIEAGEAPSTSTGPMRWATPDGLRSLVSNMANGVTVETAKFEDLPDGDVVLAMPDPQASRLTSVRDAVEYQPVITVVCEFDALELPFRDAAFVNDNPAIEFVADDGSRRGDGAPVLVVHSTAEVARAHLDDPTAAIRPVVDAVRELLGCAEPVWTHAHRWTFAKPLSAHDATFDLVESGGRRIGFAGDQWCPEGSPRVESAWRSGTDLGRALAESR